MKLMIVAGKILYIVVIVFFAAAGVFSGEFKMAADGSSLIFMLAGGAAMALMSFSLREVGAAFSHAFGVSSGVNEENLKISAYFWESMARNLLMLGVLGTVIGFVIMLKGPSSSIAAFGSGTAKAFLTTLYGVILAALCAVPALVLRKKLNNESQEPQPLPEAGKSQPVRLENIIGYLVFIAVMVWAVSHAYEVFFHWPSLLVVVGWALALLLLLGDAVTGHSVTVSFAFTGLVGIFFGMVRFLNGTGGSIQDAAAGITFSILSCAFAILGIILAGMPMEDRAFKAGKNGKGTVLSRIAWYGFPVLAIFLIAFSVLLALIPIVKK
jgi:flagellar motor component MotA